MEIVGGCLCGETRYVITEPPVDAGNCHCIDCQRASAAPYVTWGTVPATQLRLQSGAVRVVPHAGRVRSFARCCGTPLFFAEKPDSNEIDVTIASLDDPRPFAPRKNIWIEDKLPWVTLDPNLPTFTKAALKKT